jgi:hypothetical protein
MVVFTLLRKLYSPCCAAPTCCVAFLKLAASKKALAHTLKLAQGRQQLWSAVKYGLQIRFKCVRPMSNKTSALNADLGWSANLKPPLYTSAFFVQKVYMPEQDGTYLAVCLAAAGC